MNVKQLMTFLCVTVCAVTSQSYGMQANNNNSQFFKAIKEGDTATAQKLVKHIDVNMRNQDGYTALMQAAIYKQLPIAELLLANHADITLKDKHGNTALAAAIEGGNPGIVNLILHAGGNPNELDSLGRTQFMLAANRGNLPIVKLLLAYGGDIHFIDKDMDNALTLAAEAHRKEVVAFLLKAGATPNPVGKHYGRTLLMKTAGCEADPEIARLILTTISDQDAEHIRDHYYSALLSLQKTTEPHFPKDMHNVIAEKIINRIVQDRLDRAIEMLTMKTDWGETVLKFAKEWNSWDPELVKQFDISNPETRKRIRKQIDVNVRNILFAPQRKSGVEPMDIGK